MELWAQWCALQRLYLLFRDPDGGGSCSCGPNVGLSEDPTSGCTSIDPVTMKEMPIDCGKAVLCERNTPCECLATGCRGSSSTEPDLTFDLTITGATADGTISGELGDHNVHFVRAQ